jgi:phosphomannomutase
MNKFIFDVDGTLTPSRSAIDKRFAVWFRKFCLTKNVYLVTGSDYPKTLEQLGESICMSVNRIYNCSGNDVRENGINVRTNEWVLPEDAHGWLSEQLSASAFSIRTGLHFEHRPGMVNFSIVGRNANTEQRKMYVSWDKRYNERDLIAHNFNIVFPELEARPGGETGIDIAPKGFDKSQILQDFEDTDRIIFFGDRMDEDGNDYPLAQANKKGVNYHVTGWQHTWEILRNEYSTNRL